MSATVKFITIEINKDILTYRNWLSEPLDGGMFDLYH